MKFVGAFMSEAIGGALVGAALAAPIVLLARTFGAAQPGGWGDLIGALAGIAFAYPLGVGIGVVVIGRRVFKHIGLIWYTIIGAFVGAVLVGILAEPAHLNRSTTDLGIVFGIVPPLVAAGTFTLSAWIIDRSLA